MYVTDTEETSTSKVTVKNAMQYIDQHIMDDVCLETVSKHVDVSASHLIRLFKKHTEHTYLGYVTRRKMEKAAELFAKENLKVYEVSNMLGYCSERYFSKLFLKRFGCYPSKYYQTLNEQTQHEK